MKQRPPLMIAASTLLAFACANTTADVGTVYNGFGDGGVICTSGSPNQQGCPCTQGQTIACYTGDPATRGVGSCHDGTQTCTAGALQVNSAGVHLLSSPTDNYGYGPCVGEVLPSATDSCTPADAGDAATCIADLQNDPANCGSCGHGCCGGACKAGVCQAAVLASVPESSGAAPIDVGVDDSNVYWSNFVGTVQRIPKAGGPPTLFVTLPAPPNGGLKEPVLFAFDSTTVYMANAWGVFSAPKSGGNPTTLHVPDYQHGAGSRGVAVDATYVYWIDVASNTGDTATDALMRMPKGGGPVDTLATFSTDGGVTGLTPQGFVIDAANAYVATAAPDSSNQPAPVQTSSVVLRVPLAGGAPQTLYTGEPAGIRLDGAALFMNVQNVQPSGWPAGQGSFKTVGINGGPVTTIADPMPFVALIAVDATDVDWFIADSSATGRIMKMPKGGGPQVQLASGKAPFDATSDDKCVYWDTFPSSSTDTVEVLAIAK